MTDRDQEGLVELGCCPPKKSLATRALISPEHAAELEDLFKAVGNDTRIRLLHVLAKSEEACVSDIAETLGMSIQAISSQLQRLESGKFVRSRRNGNQIYYAIDDPCLESLLDHGLCLLDERRG